MAAILPDMPELDDRDREVLAVLAEGRANPMLIREKTDLDKGDVNTVLVRLGRGGYVEQITRGLYEITSKGRSEIVQSDGPRLEDALNGLLRTMNYAESQELDDIALEAAALYQRLGKEASEDDWDNIDNILGKLDLDDGGPDE